MNSVFGVAEKTSWGNVKCNENPLTMIKTNCKQFEAHCKKELAKHSLLLTETAFATDDSAINSGVFSVAFDTFTYTDSSDFYRCLGFVTPIKPLTRGNCLEKACSYAVLTDVDAGITCVMTRLRGKNDIQTAMVAGFGAGLMSSLVRGDKHAAASAILYGVTFALAKGGFFKINETHSRKDAIGRRGWSKEVGGS